MPEEAMRGNENQKWATNLQPTLNKWEGRKFSQFLSLIIAVNSNLRLICDTLGFPDISLASFDAEDKLSVSVTKYYHKSA